MKTIALLLAIAAVASSDTEYSTRAVSDCPPIISRQAWGGRDAISTTSFPDTPEFVVIIHTATSECFDSSTCSAKIRAMQNYHMDQKGWADISYNFLIGENNAIYEGTGWKHVGTHSAGYNNRSISIAFIGNFNDRLPAQTTLNRLPKLIRCGVDRRAIPTDYKLVGHRQLIATNSPGDELFNYIKKYGRWISVID